MERVLLSSMLIEWTLLPSRLAYDIPHDDGKPKNAANRELARVSQMSARAGKRHLNDALLLWISS